jgi:hypothetical protein
MILRGSCIAALVAAALLPGCAPISSRTGRGTAAERAPAPAPAGRDPGAGEFDGRDRPVTAEEARELGLESTGIFGTDRIENPEAAFRAFTLRTVVDITDATLRRKDRVSLSLRELRPDGALRVTRVLAGAIVAEVGAKITDTRAADPDRRFVRTVTVIVPADEIERLRACLKAGDLDVTR